LIDIYLHCFNVKEREEGRRRGLTGRRNLGDGKGILEEGKEIKVQKFIRRFRRNLKGY
jgi:hypothetical protein